MEDDYLDRDKLANEELREALNRLFEGRGSATVVDVGANEGQFASDILGSFVEKIYCIEPVTSCYEMLDQLSKSDRRIRPFRFAVDEVAGSCILKITESTVGSSLLAPKPGQQSHWTKVVGSEIVEVVRLDHLFEEWNLDYVDLLKVDTQGTDERVLRSAGHYLCPDFAGAILAELNFHPFYEGQGKLHTLLALLEERGYFLAEVFRHYNRSGWLWWADALFLPSRYPYSTQPEDAAS